ncbi:hypothetical protein L1887_59058 [Cichorium endivia]|nr:hypothetical protein L1887_59058 [Cichorium endivia]
MIHRKDTTALANMNVVSSNDISQSEQEKLLRAAELGLDDFLATHRQDRGQDRGQDRARLHRLQRLDRHRVRHHAQGVHLPRRLGKRSLCQHREQLHQPAHRQGHPHEGLHHSRVHPPGPVRAPTSRSRCSPSTSASLTSPTRSPSSTRSSPPTLTQAPWRTGASSPAAPRSTSTTPRSRPAVAEAHRRCPVPRGRAPVVRQHRHARLVGQPLAQRGPSPRSWARSSSSTDASPSGSPPPSSSTSTSTARSTSTAALQPPHRGAAPGRERRGRHQPGL